MTLELMKRNVNSRGEIESVFKTNIPLNSAKELSTIELAVRKVFEETIFYYREVRNEEGKLLIVHQPFRSTYRIEVLADLSDSTYTIMLTEYPGRNAVEYIPAGPIVYDEIDEFLESKQ